VVSSISYNSISAPGEEEVFHVLVFQRTLDPPAVPTAWPKNTIAVLVLAVVTPVAVTVVEVACRMVGVATSKGLVLSTPENARIPPDAAIAPLPAENP
jgi:hypothetical protein